MCQLNSIQQVTNLWRATHRQYDGVIYLRPDVLYNCPLPTDVLLRLEPDMLHIADFHHWHGYNDRFAIGTPAAAAVWGDRLTFTLATCTRRQVCSSKSNSADVSVNSPQEILIVSVVYMTVLRIKVSVWGDRLTFTQATCTCRQVCSTKHHSADVSGNSPQEIRTFSVVCMTILRIKVSVWGDRLTFTLAACTR